MVKVTTPCLSSPSLPLFFHFLVLFLSCFVLEIFADGYFRQSGRPFRVLTPQAAVHRVPQTRINCRPPFATTNSGGGGGGDEPSYFRKGATCHRGEKSEFKGETTVKLGGNRRQLWAAYASVCMCACVCGHGHIHEGMFMHICICVTACVCESIFILVRVRLVILCRLACVRVRRSYECIRTHSC